MIYQKVCWGLVFFGNLVSAQSSDTLQVPIDTELATLTINAYFHKQPILGLTSAGTTLTSKEIKAQHTTTLLPALNSIAGVRMEERSSGSYRLALRGSFIRSPFGIRNVKVYIDDLPFTDAGGNTYLNIIDPLSIDEINVIKGPDGSLYGVNSGGVLKLQPNGFKPFENNGSFLGTGGSYGLIQQHLSIQHNVSNNYAFSIDQSVSRSDGYRKHSAMEKISFQTAHRWNYNERSNLKMFALFTNFWYQTPGGLTEDQLSINPRLSRPATNMLPSAAEQNAAVFNKTFFGGLTHRTQLSTNWSHLLSVFGSTTSFENPFITNYEYRNERNLGLRTYFSYNNNNAKNVQWQLQLGFEGQKGWYAIKNFDNYFGTPAAPQAFDDLNYKQSSFFYRIQALLFNKLTVEGSLGLNQMNINFMQKFPLVDFHADDLSYKNIWMPRIAASYIIKKKFAIRTSISKGYSPPTIAEIRSSDNLVNTTLEAETGINYEAGFRYESLKGQFIADLTLYHYNMNNGIIRQMRNNGAEYYVNAGEIKQRGIEASIWNYIIPYNNIQTIKSVKLQSALSYYNYRFGNYTVDNNNFNRNKVTAVPDWVIANNLIVNLGAFHFNLRYSYTSTIPLNDANSVFADAYHLVQIKASYNKENQNKNGQYFVGIDNLLNQQYSLGNDINAFGNRFYNPAPKINIYAGVKIKW